MRDKKPRNANGQQHGYWEKYNYDGNLCYICNYIDGAWYGYFEHHFVGRIRKEYAAR
jgi:hypothetical protein